MATSTISAPATTDVTEMFTFEKVHTEDFTDYHAIFDKTKDEWVQDCWVTVPEGASVEDVVTAFSQGYITAGL